MSDDGELAFTTGANNAAGFCMLEDLRGLDPRQRAEAIIENCAHPDYRPLLHRYVEMTPTGHIPHNLEHCFDFHTAYLKTGDMRNARF